MTKKDISIFVIGGKIMPHKGKKPYKPRKGHKRNTFEKNWEYVEKVTDLIIERSRVLLWMKM